MIRNQTIGSQRKQRLAIAARLDLQEHCCRVLNGSSKTQTYSRGGVMKPKFTLLLVLILAISTSAVGQQRWFENGTGSFKRLQWENVAIVVFHHTANTSSLIGGQIFTFANGK